MVDVSRLAATAERLINANGRPVKLRKQSRNPDNPDKPWRGPDCGDEDIDVTAVILDYKEEDVDNERVRRGDRKALVEANTNQTDLRDFDQMIDGEETWRIVIAEEVRPGTVRALWKLQLRK